MRTCFSEEYGGILGKCARVREAGAPPEAALQRFWAEGVLVGEALHTLENHRVRIVAPGWANKAEGPDFLGAQVEFNGVLHGGDVEIHQSPGGWRGHGHHRDPRYRDVILHVVWDAGRSPAQPPATPEGRALATLSLTAPPAAELFHRWERSREAETLPEPSACGRCARDLSGEQRDAVTAFLDLAGEWRILEKARDMRERAAAAGLEQALYETLLRACGYARYAASFHLLARSLPYDRIRQLALLEPFLPEAALFHHAGLLPDTLPAGADDTAAAHHRRLTALRREYLGELRSLGLEWPRVGVRPVNTPERRLAGAARLVARTAKRGLLAALEELWRGEEPPLARRRTFEALFSPALGFWTTHCAWNGKSLARSAALLGGGRVRSVIGNVFLPLAVAKARDTRDRALEERALNFCRALPAEPDNQVLRRMTAWIFPEDAPRLNFLRQQGLLQMYRDWCEANPSCRNCSLHAFFKQKERTT